MTGRPRWSHVAVVVAAVLVLSACGSADGDQPGPARSSIGTTAESWSTMPAPAPSNPPAGSTDPLGGSDPLGGTDPLGSTDPTFSTNPAGSAAPSAQAATPAGESDVWIPAGDHRVPGTLALPAVQPGQQVPAVLLLHGDLGDRDADGMFVRLADALAARGIASLRIDFAGAGASEEPDLSLDYPGMVLDATAALTYLQQDQALDADRVAILGFSRGGSIAATVAGTVPGVAALVSWSGAIANAFEEDPAAHEEARENGEVVVDLGEREFQLSLAWFDTILDSHPLDDVAGYPNPVLAVVGSDDDIVDPEISNVFLATVASTDKTLYTVEGGDHGFTADPEYGDEAVAVTTDWLAATFGVS